MKDHLLMMKCLKHSSIRAEDQVTNQVFTAENWPHLNDDKTFSLDTFVNLRAREGSYQTIGLQRFDRPDLHFKNVSNLEQVWRAVTLSLVSADLEEALRIDELNFIVARRTPATLFLVYERQFSNKDAPPVPQAKPRTPNTKRRDQRPSRKPRRLPNYR